MVRDNAEHPRREKHREMPQIGKVYLIVMAREYARYNEIIGSSNQRNESYR